MINNYYLLPEFTPARLQDLVLWFEPASFRGNTWYNLAPNYSDRNHGTAHGGVGLSSWHPLFPPAPKFDGSEYLAVPNSPSIDITDEITIEMWVYPEHTGDYQTFIHKGSSSNILGHEEFSYNVRRSLTNYINFSLNIVGSGWNLVGGAQIPDNLWSYIVCTYNGSVMKVYKNSELFGSREVSGSIVSLDYNLKIGDTGNAGDPCNGTIPLVRIYKTALPHTEIIHNYTHHPLYYIRRGVDPYEFIKRKKFYFL